MASSSDLRRRATPVDRARPAVVTPDPSGTPPPPVATPVPVAIAVPATPPVLPTQQLPPRSPSDGDKCCGALGLFLVVGCLFVSAQEAVWRSDVTSKGYVQLSESTTSAWHSSYDLNKVRTAIHTRNAAGECPTRGRATRSGWARKDCALPVRLSATAPVLKKLSDRLKGPIEAVTGPNPLLCEHASLTSYPGAAIQDPHHDISNGKAVSVVVYLDGVADNETAPLELWPGSHLIRSSSGREDVRKGRASITPVKLAPLEPGAVVMYDSHLVHRGTVNSSPRARTTYWFTYCSSVNTTYISDRGTKRLPELVDARGHGRLTLSDVVDGRVEAKLAGVATSDFKDYSTEEVGDSCIDCLYAYDTYSIEELHVHDEDEHHGLGMCPEFKVSGSKHDKLHGTYIPNGTCSGRPQYKCIDCSSKSSSAWWVSSSHKWFVGPASGCGSTKGSLYSTDYLGQSSWKECKGTGQGWASTYNIEVTCQCTKLPQLIQASEDVSWCLDSYVRRDARDNVDKVSASWVQMPDDEICSTVDLESNATRHPPCAWPKMTGSDAYARATSKLFRHAVSAMEEGYTGSCDYACDINLLQALTEVGIHRKDSVLWSIVDREAPLAGVPAHRRELLASAREVVSDLVKTEEKAIESDSDDARVEACFGGRDLVKLYVKEKESLSKSELIAKQKWWARCNATEPKTKKRLKEPEEPGALASLFFFGSLVYLICACAADPQARQPAARRAA